MKLTVLQRAAAVAALMLSTGASAQDYPNKPIQVINQFNAGAVVDVLARTLSEEMSQILGQQFIVLNREGASGLIALTAIANARPDGYTLGFAPQGAIAIQPHVQKNPPYTVDSFVPVCQTFENHFAVLVGPASRFASLADMIAFARANPGKLSWGVFGVASVPSLQFYSLLRAARLEMTSVPYKSVGQMSQEVASGQLDIGITAFGSFNAYPVRPIATLAQTRNDLFPDVPTVHELGFPVSDPGFGGYLAPKGTPVEIVVKLESACARAVEAERWKAVLKRTGTPGPYLASDAYAKRLRDDAQAKLELIRALDLKFE